MVLAHVLGWVGTTLYLVAFLALSFDLLAKGRAYFSINASAAALVVVTSVATASPQAIAVNAFWLIVSLLALTGRGDWLRRARVRALVPARALALAGSLAALALALAGSFARALDALGWCGTFAFVASYALFASSAMGSREFKLWNLGAALALVPALWLDANWPVVGLELAWALIALAGLLRGPGRAEPAPV